MKTNHLTRIASYLLVFAILSNLLYIPCYFYIRNINRANAIEHYQHKLNSGMQMLDSSMDSFLALGYQVIEDSAYREVFFDDSRGDVFARDDLRKRMASYLTLPYKFISNFALTAGEQVLFTEHQLYYERTGLTYDRYFQCEDENYLKMFTDKYCVLPARHFCTTEDGDYDAVTIGYCCSSVNDMYLLMHYPVQQLLALFVDNEALSSSDIALYHGNLLLTAGGIEPEGEFQLLEVSSDSGVGIRVELRLSDAYIEQDLAEFKQLVHIFLFIVLFAIVFWVAVISWRLTKPFNQISKTLYETGFFNKESASRNSVDIIVEGIKSMGVRLSDYNLIIEEQNIRNRIHILEKALYRGLYDEESRQSFEESFPDFPANWQLALIQYISDDELVNLDSVQLLLTRYYQQKFSALILLPYSQDALLVFFPADSDNSLVAILEEARTYIQKQYPVSLSFVVSRIYDHYSLLPDAFQELEQSITLQQFASSTVDKQVLPISIQQTQTIYLSLQNGDAKAALSALRSAKENFWSCHRKDFVTAKYSYQMVVHTLIRLKLENNSLKDIPIPHFNQKDVQHVFEVELPQCFVQFAASVKQQHASQMHNLDTDIFAFIDENIGNQQLGVSMVTTRFGISAPTLQKRMNACVAKTFSAYVEDIRMKKAYQMLQDTELSIQEIAESVGYINTNSFYKAYKRCFGEGPRSTRQKGKA